MSNYTVYTHTFPNGKIYIGYLNMDSEFFNNKTFDEIMDNGRYYINRTTLYEDICKYGWENVTTEIISGLTKEEAVSKKKELCSKHQSYLPECGYNRPVDAGIKKKCERTKRSNQSTMETEKNTIKRPSVDMKCYHKANRLAWWIICNFIDKDKSVLPPSRYFLMMYSNKNLDEMQEWACSNIECIQNAMSSIDFTSNRKKAAYIIQVIEDHVV